MAIDDEQLANVLDGRGTQFAADLFIVGDTIVTAVAIDADFDQFMCLEAVVDFLEDRVGQAVFRNRNDRMQGMSLGAQFAALGQSELLHNYKTFQKRHFTK